MPLGGDIMRSIQVIQACKNGQLRAIGLIFILAVTVRIFLLFCYLNISPDNFFDFGDSYEYIHYAKNLLETGFIGNHPVANIFRTPIFIFFIAAVYFFTNNSNTAVVILQILISSATCVVVYLIAQRYVSELIAFVASLLLAIDIISVNLSIKLLSETLFSFLVAIFIIMFIKFLESKKKTWLVFAGFTVGVATLTRPILFYFAIASLPIFIYYFRERKRQAVAYFLIFNFAFVSVVGPWIYRNVREGYWGIAAVQEYNIFMFKSGWIEEMAKGNPPPSKINIEERIQKVHRIIENRGVENIPANRVKIYKELGYKTIFENPGLLALYQLKFTGEVFALSGVEEMFDQIADEKYVEPIKIAKIIITIIYSILLSVTYAMFVIGSFCQATWNSKKGVFFMMVLLLYIVSLSGELGGGPRFRAPMMPSMLVVCAVGIEYLMRVIKQYNVQIKTQN